MKYLLFLLSLTLFGCATIMHGGSTQKMGVSSTPSGAHILVDGQPYGVTPAIVSLDRGDNHIVSVQLDGYERHDLTVTQNVSGWVWGNILLGGVIGLGVDLGTGGLYNLYPENLSAEMREEKDVAKAH